MANTIGNRKDDIRSMGDTAAAAADKARDLARNAVETGREMAAGVMDRARDTASNVTDKARDVAEKARDWAGGAVDAVKDSDMVHKATDRLSDAWESGSKYVKDHSVREMADDVAGVIRRHPIPAILVGIGLGFILARSVRSH